MVLENILILTMIYHCVSTQKVNHQALSDARIKGGNDVQEGSTPFQVYLIQLNRAGVLIDERHILTAASVLYGKNTNNLQVLAGAIDVKDHNNTHHVILPTAMIYLHEQFNLTTRQNDIALIRVNGMFTFNKYVRAIRMSRKPLNTGTCLVTDWGLREKWSASFSNILQLVKVPVLEYQLCKIIFGVRYNDSIFPGMLCAGHVDGEAGVCHGDAGGPLMCDGLLSGIVSWTEGCAEPNTPGVYSDVGHFHKWIIDTIRRSYTEAKIHFSYSILSL